jgi:ABC-type multidrug transport system fused ATPase/permease subunit
VEKWHFSCSPLAFFLLNRQRGYYIIVCISENQVARKTDKRKKEKDKIIMWKCIRCEKENQDTEEICTGCGHGRTMDYISHRTLSKVANALSRNWKKANRKEAEEFVQEKITGLSHSVKEAKKKIADNQNEITILNGTVQERNKIIEKNEKIEKVTDKIIIAGWIIECLVVFYWMVSSMSADEGMTVIEYIKQNLFDSIVIGIVVGIVVMIIFSFVAVVFPLVLLPAAIIATFIGWILGKANEETLKKFTEELDNAQQSITEKTNEITTVQSELNSSEQQLKKIKKDKESIINKLSQLSPQEMEKEFARLV